MCKVLHEHVVGQHGPSDPGEATQHHAGGSWQVCHYSINKREGVISDIKAETVIFDWTERQMYL